MSLAYVIADVFTDTPLQGNQLAVFEDGPALSDDQIQRLAQEMNHSGQLPAMGLQPFQENPFRERLAQGGMDYRDMPNENPSARPAETGAGARLMRRVADATTLRALSHPVRIELLEALGMHGTMTATQVGELIGESPTTCSFHLRQLAKYGFVEEAGGGKGRARPWRMASEGLHLTVTRATRSPSSPPRRSAG